MAERDIVVIGASRGGFQGLRALVSALPADLPAAVFVVLHIGRHASMLPDLLTSWGRLIARYATHGEKVEHGTIRVAPPDRHLVLSKGRVWLSEGAKENFSRPAADPLFRSAAMEYGARVVGVVMSAAISTMAPPVSPTSAPNAVSPSCRIRTIAKRRACRVPHSNRAAPTCCVSSANSRGAFRRRCTGCRPTKLPRERR